MELLLGDIILAYGVCETEAAEKGIPVAHHATHLVIHGMLHLLGHDHIDDEEAEAMEALEVKALASMGLHNPYTRITEANKRYRFPPMSEGDSFSGSKPQPTTIATDEYGSG